MFERRLRILLGVFGVLLLVIVARLCQLQVVQAEYYRKRAEQSVRVTPKSIPFVRGSIRDRTGKVLVREEPCWELAVDYGVIAADVGRRDDGAMRRYVRRLKRRGRYPDALTDEQVERAFRDELSVMWSEMARFVGGAGAVEPTAPREYARGLHDRITRIRDVVARRRGFDAPVVEETQAHAVVTGLDAAAQIAARERFRHYPWVHVEPATSRRFGDRTTPFAHVLGRVGEVDASDIADDPEADDPFAKYCAGERVGIAGVEHAAERLLRGRRGQIVEDGDGNLIPEECIEPQNGRDVVLTIHAELQRRLYGLLGDVVDATPESSGGAVVVLDVPSREVLALVSYPAYDPSRFAELFPVLRDDTDRLPLRFRAVANRYAPGSTVKPLVCLAGLMNGRITLDDREECTGYLFPDVTDRWRCWQIHGTDERKAHGSVDVVEALIGSCNVYMYRLGERLGVDRLCSVFDMAGIGKYTGIGLPEEVRGINPTPSWLMTNKNIRATPGTARLFAIGQGELAMTPLQVANLMATYANGRFRPVSLIRATTPTPEWVIPGTAEQWRAIRRGIYGVVNEPAGTAYQYAHFEHDRWALCGKTGSATAHPWPTTYRVGWTNAQGAERVTLVRAGSRRSAIERFRAENPGAAFEPSSVSVASRWPHYPPPEGEEFSHAWVAGFLQALDSAGQPEWSEEPRVAFAILVEFGGSGGRTSGPLAKTIAAELLSVFGPELQVQSSSVAYVDP